MSLLRIIFIVNRLKSIRQIIQHQSFKILYLPLASVSKQLKSNLKINKREVDKRNTIRNLKNTVQQNAHAASNAALQNKNLIDK